MTIKLPKFVFLLFCIIVTFCKNTRAQDEELSTFNGEKYTNMDDVFYDLIKTPKNPHAKQTSYDLTIKNSHLPNIENFRIPKDMIVKSLTMNYCNIGHIERNAFRDLVHDLKTLDLSHNNLKDLEFFEIFFTYKLNTFIARNNSFGSLTFVEYNVMFRDVKYLDFSHCKLKETDLGFSPNAKFVNLSHNEIENVAPTTLKTNLDISFNKLKQFNVSISGNHTLNISNNFISELNVKPFNNSNIPQIYASNNNIKQVQMNNKMDIDLSNNKLTLTNDFLNKSLRSNLVNLSNCSLTKILHGTFTDIAYLYILNLTYNKIQLTPLMFKDSFIAKLDLSNCEISQIPEKTFSNLNVANIYLSHNEITEFKLSNTCVNKLVLSHNKIKKILPNVLKNICDLQSVDFSYNLLTKFDATVFKTNNLKKIDLGNNLINSLSSDVNKELNINVLNLENNRIVKLNEKVFHNFHIMNLNLANNELIFIHPSAFNYETKIYDLSLTYKGIFESRTFQKLTNLNELTFVNSKIDLIEKESFYLLNELKRLIFLNCTVKKIEPSAFLGLSSLKIENLNSLFLENVQNSLVQPGIFKGLTNIQKLNLSCIKLTEIKSHTFEGLKSLKLLNLSNNEITNFEVDALYDLEKLKTLDISHNLLSGNKSTFPLGIFRNSQNLEVLDLSHNKIKTFALGEFSDLFNLNKLNLSHNAIHVIDADVLFPLRNLQILDLNYNNLKRIQNKNVTFTKYLNGLRNIGIGENKWNCEKLPLLLDTFQKNNVDFTSGSVLNYFTENVNGISCIDFCNYLICNKDYQAF